MYTNIDLKLFYNGQYKAELWSKKITVKDSGNYCISNNMLIVNSYKTTYREKKFKYTREKWFKKKKRELYYHISDTPYLHINDTFGLRGDTLFYYDDREINDSTDIRFNRVYRTLIDKKSTDNSKKNPGITPCISPKESE